MSCHRCHVTDVMSRHVMYYLVASCNAIREMSSHSTHHVMSRCHVTLRDVLSGHIVQRYSWHIESCHYISPVCGKRGMGRENWIIFLRPYPSGACVVVIVYHITTVKHNVSYSEWCTLYKWVDLVRLHHHWPHPTFLELVLYDQRSTRISLPKIIKGFQRKIWDTQLSQRLYIVKTNRQFCQVLVEKKDAANTANLRHWNGEHILSFTPLYQYAYSPNRSLYIPEVLKRRIYLTIKNYF